MSFHRKEAEDVIMNDPEVSYEYARDVLKGRWLEGEKNILELEDPDIIINYAREIIKGRWTEGEKIILEIGDPFRILEYAQRVIKGRWTEGEKIILETGDPSAGISPPLYYSFYILKKRWPDMEPYLYKYRNTHDGNKNMEQYLKYFHLTEDELKKNFINKSRSLSPKR
jgi:hypothetical protein